MYAKTNGWNVEIITGTYGPDVNQTYISTIDDVNYVPSESERWPIFIASFF